MVYRESTIQKKHCCWHWKKEKKKNIIKKTEQRRSTLAVSLAVFYVSASPISLPAAAFTCGSGSSLSAKNPNTKSGSTHSRFGKRVFVSVLKPSQQLTQAAAIRARPPYLCAARTCVVNDRRVELSAGNAGQRGRRGAPACFPSRSPSPDSRRRLRRHLWRETCGTKVRCGLVWHAGRRLT